MSGHDQSLHSLLVGTDWEADEAVLLQPGKCLYTTVRELVENSLDAAESGSHLPHIDVTM